MDQFYPSSPAGFDFSSSSALESQQNHNQMSPAGAWPSRQFASPGQPHLPAGLIGSLHLTPNRTPIHDAFGSAAQAHFSPRTSSTPFCGDGASGSGNPSSALLFASLQQDMPPSMAITPQRSPNDSSKDLGVSGRSWAQPGSVTRRVLDTPERAALAAVTAATAHDLHTPQLQHTDRQAAPEAPIRNLLFLPSSLSSRSVRRLSASPQAPAPQGITPVRHTAMATPDTGCATAASATPRTGTFGAPHSAAAGGLSRHNAGCSRLTGTATGLRLISAAAARQEAVAATAAANADPLRTWQQPQKVLSVHKRLQAVKRSVRAAMWAGHAAACTMRNNLAEQPNANSGGSQQAAPAVRSAPSVYAPPAAFVPVQWAGVFASTTSEQDRAKAAAAAAPAAVQPTVEPSTSRFKGGRRPRPRSKRDQRVEAARVKALEEKVGSALQLERQSSSAAQQVSATAQLSFLNMTLQSKFAGELQSMLRTAALAAADAQLNSRPTHADGCSKSHTAVHRVWGGAKRWREAGADSSDYSSAAARPNPKSAYTGAGQCASAVLSCFSAVDSSGARLTDVQLVE